MTILVTGAAGFIGMHVCEFLLKRGNIVVGVDSINDYYDQTLKKYRLNRLLNYQNYKFYKGDISDLKFIEKVFSESRPRKVINLAAQAGVRFSLKNPHAYVQSNVVGFVNILECCRYSNVEHLIYASSSSVYGGNEKIPFATSDRVDSPISLYAATKKSNELMAYTYSHLYNLPTTGLRYFTVYGPCGRPDMSPWLFTNAITKGQAIKIFNHGKMKRDFTYVDDVVNGTILALERDTERKYKVYNIGNETPVELMDFISTIERKLGVEAKKEFLPMQPGDVASTYADINEARVDFGYQPKVSIEEGISNWVDWFCGYQKNSMI